VIAPGFAARAKYKKLVYLNLRLRSHTESTAVAGCEPLKLVKRLNSKLEQTFLIATRDPVVVNSCEKVIRNRGGEITSI